MNPPKRPVGQQRHDAALGHVQRQPVEDRLDARQRVRDLALRAELARLRGDAVRAADWDRQALAQLGENDFYLRTLVRASLAAADWLRGQLGQAERSLAEVLADKPEDTQLFICGADWWQDPIIKLAKEKYGFSDQRIHSERFTAKLVAPPLDKAFNVTIKSAGQVLSIPGEQSVATYLNDNGVRVPTSCEQGLCRACKTKILEGEADHRDSGLTDVEKAEGFFLPCVSRGKTDLVLDL